MTKLKVILLYFFLLHNLGNAQISNINFERLSSEVIKLDKGLSQNSVQAIIQDNNGYLWIGTWDGLNRFDGYNFSIIKPDYFNAGNGLSSSSIRALFIDKEGYMWIGTESGLNKYNTKTRTFIQYKNNQYYKNSLSSNYINAITEDNYGNLWVGTNQGLNKLDKKTGKIQRYFLNPTNANSISNDNINSLAFSKDGFLWIATQKGLNKLNVEKEVFSIYYQSANNTYSICSDVINCVYLDKHNNLWIGTDKGLNLYNQSKNNFFQFKNQPKNPLSLSFNDIKTIMMDSKGFLFLGTNGGGLNIMNPSNYHFYSFKNSSLDNTSLSNDYINSILEDKSGNIWLGTSWEGINKINKQSKKFRHYKNISDDNKSINNNLIWSIVSDKKGNIWFATNEGVNIFNKKTQLFSVIKNKQGDVNSLVSNKVRMIVIDHKREDIVWFATLDGGVDKYNIKTKMFTHYRYNPLVVNSLSSDRIVSMYEDKLGDIWIGTEFGGLNILNPESGKVQIYKNDSQNPYSISSDIIYPIYEDKNGIVWVGTYNGLNRFDRETKRFYKYYHNPADKNSMSSDMIFSIYQDKSGFFWLGTMGGGLNKFNPITGKAKYYTEVNGLPNDVVYSSIEDKYGNFWLSTNFGISQFNPKTETFINFDVKDGIQSHEFNYGAALIDEDGELFFGGMNGFNAFYPNDIQMNKYIPPIVISSFKLFNIDIPITINDGDNIKLDYNENFFSFEFSSLDYTNPYKNKYAFILENFDKTWNYTNASKRYADYTSVNPGKYSLKVKGTNNDGVWNEKGITIYIEIKSPWYETSVFRIILILFIILCIWGLIYWRIRRIRKKHEVEKKVLEIQKQLFELEQKSLRLQMNPHFLFNSLNSIQSFVIEKNTDKAIYYLSRFSQLMRMVLYNSQKTFVVLTDELKVIKSYMDLEKLRYNDAFDYKIDIDQEIEDEFIAIPPMIIQPYIENAIIHGLLHKNSKGKIKIEFKLIGNYIYCVIQDNGIGREASAKIKAKSGIEHKSSGMLITQERLNILNSKNKENISVKVIDLYDDMGAAVGTRIELMIIYKEF
jgi:ligand-binding sensor domain-containing protein